MSMNLNSKIFECIYMLIYNVKRDDPIVGKLYFKIGLQFDIALNVFSCFIQAEKSIVIIQ